METYEIVMGIIMISLFALEFFLFSLYEIYRDIDMTPAMVLVLSVMIFIDCIYLRIKSLVMENE